MLSRKKKWLFGKGFGRINKIQCIVGKVPLLAFAATATKNMTEDHVVTRNEKTCLVG